MITLEQLELLAKKKCWHIYGGSHLNKPLLMTFLKQKKAANIRKLDPRHWEELMATLEAMPDAAEIKQRQRTEKEQPNG